MGRSSQPQVGDELLTANGEKATVFSLEKTDESQPVYNFEVDEFHTYFVGTTAICNRQVKHIFPFESIPVI